MEAAWEGRGEREVRRVLVEVAHGRTFEPRSVRYTRMHCEIKCRDPHSWHRLYWRVGCVCLISQSIVGLTTVQRICIPMQVLA